MPVAILSTYQNVLCGWLGRVMVLGSFQCQGVLLLWNIEGQRPAVLAASAGQVGCFFFSFFHLGPTIGAFVRRKSFVGFPVLELIKYS